MRNNPRYFKVFSDLGNTWVPSANLQSDLETFVCLLFGSKRIKKVNDLRHHLYKKKFEGQEEKVIDLSLLPPCSDSLQLHIFRSAYVARRWRLSIQSNFEEPDKKHHGWNDDGRIQWVRKAFPSDVELLLVDEAEERNNSEGTENDDDQVEMEYQEPGDESEGSDMEEEN